MLDAAANMAGNVSINTTLPPWLAPSRDIWKHYYPEALSLLIFYILTFAIGQALNWLCLLTINRTKLTQSSRYLMMSSCVFNTIYLTISCPHKIVLLCRQRTFLPEWIRAILGATYLLTIFGSSTVQVRDYSRPSIVGTPQNWRKFFGPKKHFVSKIPSTNGMP